MDAATAAGVLIDERDKLKRLVLDLAEVILGGEKTESNWATCVRLLDDAGYDDQRVQELRGQQR